MAAETLTATRAASTFPVYKPSGAGLLCVAWGTYAVAANVEDGDIFEMLKVPSGATIVGGYLQADAKAFQSGRDHGPGYGHSQYLTD